MGSDRPILGGVFAVFIVAADDRGVLGAGAQEDAGGSGDGPVHGQLVEVGGGERGDKFVGAGLLYAADQ